MSSSPLTKQRPDLSGRLPRSGRQRGRTVGSTLNFNSKSKVRNSQLRLSLTAFFDEPLIRPDAFAREGDAVAGAFLDDVHGLVSHAQDFPVGAAIGGECGHAEAGGHLDVKILLLEEDLRIKQILEAAQDDQSVFFGGLGQDYHEFVAPIAKRIINQSQVALDEIADHPKELRAHEMAMNVVDLLEVIEVKEDHGELVTVTGRAVDFRIQNEFEVPGVIEGGAVIYNGEFVDALHVPCIFECNGRVVGKAL